MFFPIVRNHNNILAFGCFLAGWQAYFWLAFLPLVVRLFKTFTWICHVANAPFWYWWLRLILSVTSTLHLQIVLLVGTKLQVIIIKMAVEIQARHAVVKGLPVVKPSNEHFWFGRPQLVLFLIHFVLFVV